MVAEFHCPDSNGAPESHEEGTEVGGLEHGFGAEAIVFLDSIDGVDNEDTNAPCTIIR